MDRISIKKSVEHLSFDQILNELSKVHKTFYKDLIVGNWVICLPDLSLVEDDNWDISFYESHVFIPTKTINIYETLNKKEILVKNQSLETGEGFDEKREVKILFTETHYDDNYNPIRTVLVSKPLVGKLKMNDSENTGMALKHIFGNPKKDTKFLETFSGGKIITNLVKTSTEYQKSFIMLCETLKKGKQFIKGLQRTIAIFMKKIWILAENTSSEFLKVKKILDISEKAHISRKMLVLACEGIIMEKNYDSVLRILIDIHQEHDNKVEMSIKKLNGKISSEMVELSSDLNDINLDNSVIIFQKIVHKKTPYSKLNILKKTIKNILTTVENLNKKNENERYLTADDLLPLLISVIIQANISKLCAHLSFIQFRQEKTSEINYYITTVRAAVEFIRKNVYQNLFNLKLPKKVQTVSIQNPISENNKDLLKTSSTSVPIKPSSTSLIVNNNGSFNRFDNINNDPNNSIKTNGSMDSSGDLFYQIHDENQKMNVTELKEIIEEMQNQEIGIEIKERKSFFKSYEACFVAKEVVAWLIKLKNYSEGYSVEVIDMMLQHKLIACLNSPNIKSFQNNSDFWKFV
eukprot:TRINITY_DN8888_c0_g1_i1.p1 TRINITY_DN8888_c0_g1~~TRINITY_DN8888_c0_g1_i1.p1  ORF type:complete len:578 (-),score=126.45 TRINITY_DN8888_c0_g1_i1:33-1766(-)